MTTPSDNEKTTEELNRKLESFLRFYDDVEGVRALLDQGAELEPKGEYEEAPLARAAYEGHFDIVVLLLECGADVNYEHGRLDSPLRAAVRGGHVEIVEFLLTQGASFKPG